MNLKNKNKFIAETSVKKIAAMIGVIEEKDPSPSCAS